MCSVGRYLEPPHPRSETGADEGIGRTTTALDDLPVIDVNRGLSFASGQMPLYMSLLRIFERLHASDAKTLKGLVASRRTEEALRLVHTLKGVADSLGATELRDLCRVIEERLPDRLKEGDIEALSHAHSRVLDAIAQLPVPTAASAGNTDAASTTWSELVEEMRTLLEQGNLRALDLMSTCRSHVGGRHEELMSDLEYLLMQYRFDDASESLKCLDAAMRVTQ